MSKDQNIMVHAICAAIIYAAGQSAPEDLEGISLEDCVSRAGEILTEVEEVYRGEDGTDC